MSRILSPLLDRSTLLSLRAAQEAGERAWQGSLDLGRSEETVGLDAEGFGWRGQHYPWPDPPRERTLLYWDGGAFAPVQRFGGSLIKLVPTDWRAPTFEIDGIKMLPTSKVSPWEDAGHKVALVAPAGKCILDCCGGLGYYAAWCLAGGAAAVESFEKNPDVLWLRQLNPWSPDADDPANGGRFRLTRADISKHIASLPDRSFDAVMHDPPRFGIAGELYSQVFYDHLARVLRPGGLMFHYTGAPNAKTSGRDVPGEVIRRLERAGFAAERRLDGVFARSRAGRMRQNG
ncbi:class I SAM-dependent methyltransferase [Pseudomarimonas salicorniae]|uniref:SAM-dependent methyltransferase n=1 Tax=Pseudomarimonas salicorniae TaxID=2933270 RepID=A0ABT0GKL1_9GAMM|nr:SAM-dependent methyltransferase [Lysobacter sp. CAU 1642]MCK7594917.1 SAM-dependent methyltransferase [Lysobacter sp. CAU 1642]